MKGITAPYPPTPYPPKGPHDLSVDALIHEPFLLKALGLQSRIRDLMKRGRDVHEGTTVQGLTFKMLL